MSTDDIIFKEIENAAALNPNDFYHFGWEGTGPFAFYRYACAYYDSACALFDDVKANTIVRGNPAIFYKEIYE